MFSYKHNNIYVQHGQVVSIKIFVKISGIINKNRQNEVLNGKDVFIFASMKIAFLFKNFVFVIYNSIFVEFYAKKLHFKLQTITLPCQY